MTEKEKQQTVFIKISSRHKSDRWIFLISTPEQPNAIFPPDTGAADYPMLAFLDNLPSQLLQS